MCPSPTNQMGGGISIRLISYNWTEAWEESLSTYEHSGCLMKRDNLYADKSSDLLLYNVVRFRRYVLTICLLTNSVIRRRLLDV